MKDRDDNFDQAFDEDTEVSKVNPSKPTQDPTGPELAKAAAAIGGLAATPSSQIFESMPSVDQRISRKSAKPADEWGESSEFDAVGEADRSASGEGGEEGAGDQAGGEDQEFDVITGVVSKTPTAPTPYSEPDTVRGEMVEPTPVAAPAPTPTPTSQPPTSQPTPAAPRLPTPNPVAASPAPLAFEGTMDFEESAPREIATDEASGTQRYLKAIADPLDDEFTVEVEVLRKARRAAAPPAQAATPAPATTPVPASAAAPEPEPEKIDDETFGAQLLAAWSECTPQRDLPSKQQRVAFAEAAVAIQAVLLSNPEQQDAKSLLIAQLKKQVNAQEGLVSYTPDWRACDKELGTLLPKIEKLVAAGSKDITPRKYRGPYLSQSFRQATCVDYFEHEVRTADMGLKWWERITSLALASATRRHSGGVRSMLPVADVVKLWDGRLPAQKMQTSTIVAAVRFFEDAGEKLAALKEPRELFDKGLALEVIGYQIALRDEFFRPEVLYACAEYHNKLNNWLQLPENRALLGAVNENFSGAYKKAGSIFGL